jgi:hypothetical protein
MATRKTKRGAKKEEANIPVEQLQEAVQEAKPLPFPQKHRLMFDG